MIFVGRVDHLGILTRRLRYGDIYASYVYNWQGYVQTLTSINIMSNRANLRQFLDKCQARFNTKAILSS